MKRWIPILAVVFAVQVLIAGALTLRTDAVGASTPSSPLIAIASGDVDHVVIDDKSGTTASVELVKQNGKWLLHNYFDAPANQIKVDELLGKLVELKRGLPIATSKPALHRFKVSDDTYERRVTLSGKGKVLAAIYFGDSPGVHQTDARTAKDQAVYAVDLPVYELPAKAQDWFNADLLQHPSQQLAELDINEASKTNLKLIRAASDNKQSSKQDKQVQPAAEPVAAWQVPNLGAGKQVDVAHVDELMRTINGLRVTAVLGKDAKPEWQMDHPLLELTLKDDHGQARSWTLAKSSTGDTDVLKSSAYPWYFSIAADTAKLLLDDSNSNTLVVSAHDNNKSGDKSKALAGDARKKSGSA